MYLAAVSLLLDPSHGLITRKARCPTRILKGGRVRIRSKGRVIRYVCLSGYQLLGNRYSTCVRGRWDLPAPVCIKEGCDSFNVPHGQVLETYRGAFTTVHCDPGYSLVGNQGLYCNGALWNDTLPICREIEGSAQKECDFEREDLCGWSHDADQDFNWKRHNFATPSGYAGTGPSFDHTLGQGLNGHYMYLESSSPRLENDTARLYSPVFKMPTNESSCFIFWYHMFGDTTGTLNVYLHGTDSELLLSKSGDQGDQWQEAVLPLPFINSSFQILIEGVRGAGYESDIAIDDVKLAAGHKCPVITATSDEINRATEDSSCENRCFNATTDPSLCECTPDCISNNTCCPDYLQMCATVTEASEWPTSQGEIEISTFDDSTTITSSPNTMPVSTTSTPNKAASTLNTTFVPNRLPVHNSTLPALHLTPTAPNIFSSDTRKSTVTTFRIQLNTTIPTEYFTLKPKTMNGSTVTNVRSSTYTSNPASRKQLVINSLSSSTVPNIYNTSTIRIQNESSTKSSNSSLANTPTPTPITYSQVTSLLHVERTTSNSTYSKRPNKNQTYADRPERRKVIFPTERVPPTQSYQTATFVEQTTFSSAHSKSQGKLNTTTLRPAGTFDRRRILFPYKTVPTKTYPRYPVSTKPTKKSLFSLHSTSMRTQQIIFNTPPPDIIFRTTKSTNSQQSTSVLVNRTVGTSSKNYTSQLYPTFLKNSTIKKVKSIKNDILYHGWTKLSTTLVPLTPSKPYSDQHYPTSLSSSTPQPSASTSRNLHSTSLSFDYDNFVENKWRSKYKPINRDSAPNIASFKRAPSSNEAERNIVWVCLVFFALSTVLVSVYVVRRKKRRINRRTNEDDELDIRFLGADEMLDFTLSRPDVSEERTL